MTRFVAGLTMPEEFQPRSKAVLPPYDPNRREFRILDHVGPVRRRSGNYWTKCPSCAQQGRDRSGDNLAICVADPRKYKCWAGCTKEMIRAAGRLLHQIQNCELSMSNQEQLQTKAMNHNQILALRGLRLPAMTLKGLSLRESIASPQSPSSISIWQEGTCCAVWSQAAPSLIWGHIAALWTKTGHPISWLQRVDSIAVNGVHAVVVSPGLVRLQMVRVRHTYDLLITQHVLAAIQGVKRPTLQSSIVFYGRRGTLEMDLHGKDSGFCGTVRPLFLSRSGEPASLPASFEDAVVRVTAAVSCVGCRHSHLLQPGGIKNPGVVSPETEKVLH